MSPEQKPNPAPVDGMVMPVVEACPMCGIDFTDHQGVIGMCRRVHLMRAALEHVDQIANDSDCEHAAIGQILGVTSRAFNDLKA